MVILYRIVSGGSYRQPEFHLKKCPDVGERAPPFRVAGLRRQGRPRTSRQTCTRFICSNKCVCKYVLTFRIRHWSHCERITRQQGGVSSEVVYSVGIPRGSSDARRTFTTMCVRVAKCLGEDWGKRVHI